MDEANSPEMKDSGCGRGVSGELPTARSVSDNDNQHFVTKAHLDKFIHPTSKDRVLYPYIKGEGARSAKGTKQLACADHFYLQQESGTPTNKLDDVRKKSEALFFASGKRTCSPLANCIYEDDFSPTRSDRLLLAHAAAFLRCGTPVQIQNTAMMLLLDNQQDLFNQMGSDEIRRKVEKEYGEETEQKILEAREAIWNGKVRIDVGKENWKQLGFLSVHTEEIWIDTLMQMGLTICTSYPDAFFLTSDNPVIINCQTQRDSPGLRSKDAEVWFPISHNRALRWTWKHQGILRTTFGHSATREHNRQMIRWCYREVYSPLPEGWINDAAKECNFDPCYGYYGSLEKVSTAQTFHIIDEEGKKRELVDNLAALRAGEKRDVLRLKSHRSPRRSRRP